MRIRPILPVLLLFSCHLGSEEFTDEFFEMDLSELLAVTVSAPGKIAQSQSMSPAVVQVITREDIRNFGATNLLQVLDRATSINMLGSFFYPQNLAVIRGVQLTHSNNEVLILINGRPLRDSFTGGQNFSLYTAFPIDMIKHIEIIRGPGSALYGTNAFTGVINITTEEVPQALEFKVTSGSFDSVEFNAQNSHQGERFTTNYGVRYFEEDGWKHAAFDNAGGAGQFDTGEENYSLFLNSHSKQWTINALHLHSEQAFWGSVSSWSGPEQDSRVVESTKQMLDVGHKMDLNDKHRLDTNLSLTSSHFSHYNYDAKSTNWLAEITHHFTAESGAHWVSGSTAWHQDVKTLDGLRAAPIPAFSRNWWTAYSQYQSLTNEKVNWTLGLQINKVPDVDANFVPRFNLNVAIDDKSGIKINYASAFRAAYSVETNFNLIVCCDDEGNNRGGLRGNPMLKPEEISTGELQYYLQGAHSQFNITLFSSKLTNLIERERAADKVLDFLNRGELSSKGLELEGKYQFSKQTRISYAYTYQTNDSDEVEDYTLMPNHMAKVGLSHKFENGVNIGAFNSYFSQFHRNIKRNPSSRDLNPEAESYNMLTLDVRYPFQLSGYGAEVSLFGYNLLDETVMQPEIAGRSINTHPLRSGLAWYASFRMTF